MSERIRRLELIGHATWPSLDDEWLNGWLLRAGGGATRRSNSASPVYDLDLDLDHQISACEQWFERRGLPPIFRLTACDLGAIIMTRPIAGIPAIDASRVAIADNPTEGWLDLMAREPGRGGAKRAVLAELLGRIELPAGFAAIVHADRMRAIGLGVVADEYVALFMLQTVEDQRRRGLARAVTAALVSWGAGEGATQAFLQVHPSNAPAIAFYRSQGFEQQYEYWYRQ